MLQNATGLKVEAEENFKRLSAMDQAAYKPIYGIFLLNEGRREEAVREFERLANENRKTAIDRSRLVDAYQLVGRPGDARRVIDQVLKKHLWSAHCCNGHKCSSQRNNSAKRKRDSLKSSSKSPSPRKLIMRWRKSRKVRVKCFQYRQRSVQSPGTKSRLHLAVRVELSGDLITSNKPKER